MLRTVAMSLFAGLTCLHAQTTVQSERLTRIEENTSALKSTVDKADRTLEGLQRDLRALQDRIIAVESQNKIIVSIASMAFLIGVSFLAWLWKKFEATMQQSGSRQDFTAKDRELLLKIYEKIPDRGREAGAAH